MCSTFRDVACIQQRHAHEAMTDHERTCRPLPLGERQELRRKLARFHRNAGRWLTLAEHAAREDRLNGKSLFRDR